MLADELHNLRNRTSSLKIECQEIKGKFDETSVKISESLSKLQLKVEEQVRFLFKGAILRDIHLAHHKLRSNLTDLYFRQLNKRIW